MSSRVDFFARVRRTVALRGAAFFGAAAAAFARAGGPTPEPSDSTVAAARDRLEAPLRQQSGITAYDLRRQLQEIAAEKVGVLRSGPALQEAVSRLDELNREALPRLSSRARERRFNREWVECLQAESMLATLQAIARSALLREESRGAHYRRDFAQTDNDRWLVNTLVRQRDDHVELETTPVRMTKIKVEA